MAKEGLKSGGGEVSISASGQTLIKSRADKNVNITSNLALTGNQTISGTLAVTGVTTQTGALTLGTGTALTRIAYYTATLTPAEVAADTTAEQLFTVTGITAGDVVFVNKPTAQAGLGIVGVRASAANQVGITFCNVTVGALTPTAAQAYVFGVLR